MSFWHNGGRPSQPPTQGAATKAPPSERIGKSGTKQSPSSPPTNPPKPAKSYCPYCGALKGKH